MIHTVTEWTWLLGAATVAILLEHHCLIRIYHSDCWRMVHARAK